MELEHGVVTLFDANEGLDFGLLQVLDRGDRLTGEEVTFHYNDGCFMEIIDDCKIVFGDSALIDPKGWKVHLDVPSVGDKLVFTKISGKASPWTFDEVFQSCQRELAELPPVYRVVRRRVDLTCYDADNRYKEEILWMGRDTGELSVRFPKWDLGSQMFDDALGATVPNKYLRQTTWLQMRLPDGSWETVEDHDDPRVFLCCIPSQIYDKYAPEHAGRQPPCLHGN